MQKATTSTATEGAGPALPPIVIVCEHASNHIPEKYGTLGLSEIERNSHIAWDPGALPVAQHMARTLDADLVAGDVSRLIYDCNRPPHAPDAMPAASEATIIPGNADLSETERLERIDNVYDPFRARVAAALDATSAPPVLVTIHSFTPVYLGKPRAVELGILHDRDTRLADQMLALSATEMELKAERNSPYGPEDGVTHTLIEHGIKNNYLNIMIEIRSDLIASEHQQKDMADRLSGLVKSALATLQQAVAS